MSLKSFSIPCRDEQVGKGVLSTTGALEGTAGGGYSKDGLKIGNVVDN